MSRVQKFEHMRDCQTKCRYSTKKKAKEVALRAVENGRVEALSVYSCRFCNGYHLSRRTRGAGPTFLVTG